MKRNYLSILFVILGFFSVTVHAEQGAEKFLDAIVEVRISVPENARTAERFGTNRVASGVVIDKTGHILTIGFQTIEAETIEIVGKDRKTVNAIVVAYDRHTGFGLLRATSPLQVTPMPLGSSSEVKKGDPVLAASYGSKDAVWGSWWLPGKNLPVHGSIFWRMRYLQRLRLSISAVPLLLIAMAT